MSARRTELVLTDGVVTLRPRRASDIALFIEGCADPEIARWTSWSCPLPEEVARARFTREENEVDSGNRLSFTVIGRDSSFYGNYTLRILGERTGAVGYWVVATARGNGIAVRASKLVIGLSFSELGLDRLELITHASNTASVKVAQRSGFELVGRFTHHCNGDSEQMLRFVRRRHES